MTVLWHVLDYEDLHSLGKSEWHLSCVTYYADHECPIATVRGVVTSSRVVMNSYSFCTLFKTLHLQSVTPSMALILHRASASTRNWWDFNGEMQETACSGLTWPLWELPALVKYFDGQSWISAQILGKVLFILRCRDRTAVMTGEVVSWRFLSKSVRFVIQ